MANKKEINKILGNLEREVMDVVWVLKNASVREVLNNIKRKKKPAYTTVMTVMSRLKDKKLLRRKMQGDTYIYAPVQDRQSFFASATKNIVSGLFKDFGEDLAIAEFMDHIEKSDITKSKDLRKRLAKLL